jgi:hypothetical protein
MELSTVEWHSYDELQKGVAEARSRFHKPFFMEVLITACWNIWLIRNAKIFRGEKPTFARWKAKFVHDMLLLQHRIKDKHRQALLDWIQALP